MISLAQLKNFTNQELISHLESVMHHSPVILELIKRLQKADDEEVSLANINDKVECPVCMASLQADLDTANSMFRLKIDPHH